MLGLPWFRSYMKIATSLDNYAKVVVFKQWRSRHDSSTKRYQEEIEGPRICQGDGNVSKACRYFRISREFFYRWKKALAEQGEDGLVNSKPCPENSRLRTPPNIEEKVLYLRKNYHLGPIRIAVCRQSKWDKFCFLLKDTFPVNIWSNNLLV